MRKLMACFAGFSLTLSFVVSLVLPLAAHSAAPSKRPRLVLAIVIDQFRADYLSRFKQRFLPARPAGGGVGGFAYLMSRGAYYPLAEYGVLQNMTGPGHSMILSGSLPYQSGVPINTWYDPAKGKPRYCVADETAPVVGGAADAAGVSPRSFIGTTVGDELKNAGHPTRVVTVALKDRAAVLLGGKRADLALWMDPPSFHWVSSKYYLGERGLPDWVTSVNARLDGLKGQSYHWKSQGKPSGLSLPSFGQFERSAPIGGKESLSMPLGLELTTELALSALARMKLGAGAGPDLLALSYSSHDYLGHLNGPNTLDMEEITVAEDREISKLLNAVAKAVPGGLAEVAVVLTADHGVPPSSSWLAYNRIDAGRISVEEVSALIEARLGARFGKPGSEKWIGYTGDLSFYFNPKALAATQAPKDQVEAEAKAALSAVKGVAHVVTESDYLAHRLPPGMHGRQVMNTFYPGRSADVMVIPRPFYMHDEDPLSHHTGYAYDRTVPLILAGQAFKPGIRAEKADVIDIAATLSFVLGTVPPALSEGRVLAEALR